MSDIWSALRPRLEFLSSPLPLAELAGADSHRKELAPFLVAELEAVAADPAPAQADGYVLHLYAMLLLARWRDSRAYRPLAELGHLDEATVDTVFGQLVHDSYGRALASTCDGDAGPLIRLADDEDASRWARGAALEGLALAALEGIIPRGPAIDYLADFGSREARNLLEHPERQEDLPLLDQLATHLADLGAAEQLAEIHEWFAAGLIDDSYLDPQQLDEDIRRGPAAALQALRDSGHGLIDDIPRETAMWSAIHHVPPAVLPPIPLGTLREPIVREGAKVGRNDPCPCGSGRKYKKCHGAT